MKVENVSYDIIKRQLYSNRYHLVLIQISQTNHNPPQTGHYCPQSRPLSPNPVQTNQSLFVYHNQTTSRVPSSPQTTLTKHNTPQIYHHTRPAQSHLYVYIIKQPSTIVT